MGRAQARPPFTLFCYRPPGAASGQPKPTGRPRQTSSTDDLSAWHSAPSAPTHSGRPQSSCQLTGRRVRPGVTAATPLTLAAASHWLAGPSLRLRHRQCRCHYRARPRERQALIRECLGQCESVSTQVKD